MFFFCFSSPSEVSKWEKYEKPESERCLEFICIWLSDCWTGPCFEQNVRVAFRHCILTNNHEINVIIASVYSYWFMCVCCYVSIFFFHFYYSDEKWRWNSCLIVSSHFYFRLLFFVCFSYVHVFIYLVVWIGFGQTYFWLRHFACASNKSNVATQQYEELDSWLYDNSDSVLLNWSLLILVWIASTFRRRHTNTQTHHFYLVWQNLSSLIKHRIEIVRQFIDLTSDKYDVWNKWERKKIFASIEIRETQFQSYHNNFFIWLKWSNVLIIENLDDIFLCIYGIIMLSLFELRVHILFDA